MKTCIDCDVFDIKTPQTGSRCGYDWEEAYPTRPMCGAMRKLIALEMIAAQSIKLVTVPPKIEIYPDELTIDGRECRLGFIGQTATRGYFDCSTNELVRTIGVPSYSKPDEPEA